MDNKHPDAKQEGRASLAFAYDFGKKYTSASDAENGKNYTCPYCGCPMHVTKTAKGMSIFARNPGKVHTDPVCITAERKGVERSFGDMDPKSFIVSLCHATPRKTKPELEGPIGHVGPPKGEEKPEDPDDFRVLSFTSLKQISESGIDHLKAEDLTGNHKVSDYIMTYKYAKDFFSNPGFRLGARIVYGRFAFVDAQKQAIVFSMFQANSFSVRFRVFFPTRKTFFEYRDKFVECKADSNGRTKFTKRYAAQDVLIACDSWEYIENSRCSDVCNSKKDYCTTCCGMYQATFTSSKQLYLIPADY